MSLVDNSHPNHIIVYMWAGTSAMWPEIVLGSASAYNSKTANFLFLDGEETVLPRI